MAIDPELLAEMQRRGISPRAPAASPSIKDRLMGMADSAAEAAPTAGMMVGGSLGGAAGAAAGGVGAVPGAVAGAGLGAAGGEGYKKVYQYLMGRKDPAADTSLGNAGGIAKAGLAGMGGEVLGQQAGAVLKALRPGAAKVGAGVMKVAASIPEKYGEAVLMKPSILNDAQPREAMGKSYNAFEGYTGLEGLQRKLVSENRATAPSGELEGMVLSPANRIMRGEKVDPQELYLGSQAASKLKLAAKYGEPQAQMAAASGAISQGKNIVDDALGETYPEYGSLRRGNFESRAREAFSTIMPKNKGGTTNVLRPVTAAGAALATGHPGALLATSPAAWGLGIRAGSAMSPIAKLLAKLKMNSEIQDAANPE